MAKADPFRDFLFGQGGRKSRKQQIVTIERDGTKMDVLVLQPSIADTVAIQALKDDNFAAIVETVIRCAAEPGSTRALFTDADRQQLLDQPVNGWVEDIAKVAFELARPATRPGADDPKGDSKDGSSTSSSPA